MGRKPTLRESSPEPSRNGLLPMPGPAEPWGTGHDVDAYARDAYARGFRRIAGVDEAGRGPLAGPVVAGAVVFERGVFHPDVRDSKALSRKRREFLAEWIEGRASSWAVGLAEPREIDRLNILRASLLAMSRAVRDLAVAPDFLMIDGPYAIPSASFTEEGAAWSSAPRQKAIKRGDSLCFSIAAASILAKVARDRMMEEFDARYPEYGFASNKGYGSRGHAAALRRHGPCPIHRRSFRPVRESCRDPGRSLPVPSFGARNRDGP